MIRAKELWRRLGVLKQTGEGCSSEASESIGVDKGERDRILLSSRGRGLSRGTGSLKGDVEESESSGDESSGGGID